MSYNARSLTILIVALAFVPRAQAQDPYTSVIPGTKTAGSPNVHAVGHLPLDGRGHTADITVEQELSRPYAYTAQDGQPSGIDIISIKNPAKPKVIYSWRIENPELHLGGGSKNPMYLKSRGRYYLTNAWQFNTGGPDVDLGASVWDVTGLPDTSTVKELARIHVPDIPGGFHESYSYKHSSGAALLITTTQSIWAHLYDIDKVVAKTPDGGLVGRIPDPSGRVPGPGDPQTRFGYHDMYVGYDPASHRDIFYGAGLGGYYVYDITNLSDPKLLFTMTGIAGISTGHTFTPDPTGRYAVVETEYKYAPLRIFDLKPGFDGTTKVISRPIGAWNADWHDLAHNMEVRWPYVFVSAYADGLQVFNMMDPTNPYTVGYYYTCDCPPSGGNGFGGGAWGVQVRNADGLVVISDINTGFWTLKMDGFDGWNGHQWGVPNVSSAQDWDNGPEGAPKPGKVS
jgi:hypothetical protein